MSGTLANNKEPGLPEYLGRTLQISFLLYGLTALASLGWFWVGDPQTQDQVKFWVSVGFALATVIFLFTGSSLISDLISALKRKLLQGPAKPSDV